MRVTKFVFISLSCLFAFSCVSRKTNFGTKTEIFDKKDSANSLKKIAEIKSLDFSDFKEGIFDNGNQKVSYRLLEPENIHAEKKYPLILVFHGSGAIGDNNNSQMGILSKMWLLPENRSQYAAFVLAPQFPKRSSNYTLDQGRNVLASESNEYLDLVLKSVDSLSEAKNIDRNRIYVIGFSMGGSTVSNAISKRPDLFAAAINVSGISEFDKIPQLYKIPIWVVHGSLDTDNFPQSNFRFFEEMKAKGKIFLWDYKDKYHNNILSADLVSQIPKWLFKQNKQNNY